LTTSVARVLIRAERVQLIEADLGHRSRGDPAADGMADDADAAEHLDRLGEQPL
jgi:hypothetical protein